MLDLTRKVNNQRLPTAEQAKLAKGEVWQGENAEDEMRWLYGADSKEEITGVCQVAGIEIPSHRDCESHTCRNPFGVDQISSFSN